MVKKSTNSQNNIRFLLDENMPLSTLNMLKEKGFLVEHVKEILEGYPDKKIAEHAKNQYTILITKDIELGSIILYPKGSHHGLLILRLPFYFSGEQITKTLEEFLDTNDPKQLVNNCTVLQLGKYRKRKL